MENLKIFSISFSIVTLFLILPSLAIGFAGLIIGTIALIVSVFFYGITRNFIEDRNYSTNRII